MEQKVLEKWLARTTSDLESTRRRVGMNKIKGTIEGHENSTSHAVHLKLLKRHNRHVLSIKIKLWKQSFKIETPDFAFDLLKPESIANVRTFEDLLVFINENEKN